MLNTSPLTDICFTNIISQGAACLFIILTVAYAEQKFLIWTNSNLIIFSFMDHDFGVISKKSSPESPKFFLYYILGAF